ncbi:hypothetical protein [Mesonia sp. HuA40]|uniref:hypothetical protein n=1 Tax=Mesonia sp. HuA40 TaxID=2602761 RepID=UPI0011C9801D|nr:hypothetical protein [Mesonia sp. HuA40]TXK70231.1 hypothetical protein FT993_12135 [Mesonia sp. HuA40]
MLILYFITSIFGALLPYYLSRKHQLDVIKASALPSLAVGLIALIAENSYNAPIAYELSLVFYGASFVGMVNYRVLPKYYQVALCGFIFSILYLNASSFFNGFGGGLGTAAAITTIALYGLIKIPVLKRLVLKRDK